MEGAASLAQAPMAVNDSLTEESSLPSAPGRRRVTASTMSAAPSSPPESTKSPIESSSVARCSATRSSTPSYRPQISTIRSSGQTDAQFLGEIICRRRREEQSLFRSSRVYQLYLISLFHVGARHPSLVLGTSAVPLQRQNLRCLLRAVRVLRGELSLPAEIRRHRKAAPVSGPSLRRRRTGGRPRCDGGRAYIHAGRARARPPDALRAPAARFHNQADR